MDEEIAALVQEAREAADELTNAQLSAPNIVLNEHGGIDFDEWVTYVNVMTRLLTTQTVRLTALSVFLAHRAEQ